jgi:hypothetical protein
MKLRIFGNSIRLRLDRQQVARVAAGQILEEHTELSPNPLVYRLSSAADALSPIASFSGGRLDIVLPVAVVQQWAESDQVGIESMLPIDGGGSLQLLVEKDFKCLHRDGQDQADAYPNPLDPAGS